MESITINWLSSQVPEFGELTANEKLAIIDFSLIWSFFEGACLENHASMGQIRKYVGNLTNDIISMFDDGEIVEYFRERYTVGTAFTHHYEYLYLEKSGNPPEVTDMLLRPDASKSVELIGCLGVIFRYRNNLFHGEKWRYGLRGQQHNFERSSALLRWLIEQTIYPGG